MYQINGAASVLTAFPNTTTAQNLDLIQIISTVSGSTLVNVDYTGVVHKPASSPTNGTRIGVFATNLTSASSLAAIFASAFSNPSLQDIIQVQNEGGNISYYLNYQGVKTGS